jgi:hypothetical protein
MRTPTPPSTGRPSPPAPPGATNTARDIARQPLKTARTGAAATTARGGSRRSSRLAVPLLALLTLALPGCAPDPDPPATPPPATPSAARTTTTAPSPSPSPSWPVRAPDDPDWTSDQLAAAHLVDAFLEWRQAAWADPPNADYLPLGHLLAEPLLSSAIANLNHAANTGKLVPGGVTPVTRTVGEEQLVDGRREIAVQQCDEDDPGSYVVENGATRPPVGGTRAEYKYVAQWIEEVQGWRIVEVTQVKSYC